ncbi:MAG TPA: alpha/beta fold hydrolase [Dehalococcoidales bacterium]
MKGLVYRELLAVGYNVIEICHHRPPFVHRPQFPDNFDKNKKRGPMPVARVDGININYRVEGQGEPLVMIMGFGTNLRGWIFQVPFFKKYYRVITFDNRGVGKSDKPPGPYSTKVMAEDTLGLMDHLDIRKAQIIGVSMGGMITQELAINYPERVLKLVLGCTYANKQGAGKDIKGVAEFTQLPNPNLSVFIVRLFFNNPLYRLISGLLVRLGLAFMGASTKAGLKAQKDACNKHDTLDRLQLIKAPTLVITGTSDKIIKPGSSDVIASKIPGARLVKIEGGSHAFYFEMKNVFNKEVLKFLQNSTSPTKSYHKPS